jgi:hypothetical protein
LIPDFCTIIGARHQYRAPTLLPNPIIPAAETSPAA